MFERDLTVQSAIDFEGKPLSKEDSTKIPIGGCDYIATYNEHLAVGQVKGLRHPQEDMITQGSVPKLYFEQATDIRRAFIHKVCEKLQTKLSHSVPEIWDSGTTALFLFTNGEVIDIGYLGDSEVFLWVEEPGKQTQCHLLNTFLHHATHPDERRRIEAAGGVVEPGKDGLERLQRQLMVTRGIGNNKINGLNDAKKILGREPTFISEQITHGVNQTIRVIAATDGLTATVPVDAHATYIEAKLDKLTGKSPEQQVRKLLKAVKKDGSADDVTAAILKLTKGMRPIFLAEFDSHWGSKVAVKATEVITEILNEEFAQITSYKDDQTASVGSLSSQERSPMLPDDEKLLGTPVTTPQKPAAAGPDPTREEISRRVLVRNNALVFRLGKRGIDQEQESEQEDFEPGKVTKGSSQS